MAKGKSPAPPRQRASKQGSSQAAKDVRSQIKRLNKEARDLLSKAGKDVRQVRHEMAILKKAGIVSPKLDVRSYVPSKYMLRKIERNADIISGRSLAVKAPKAIRDKYAASGIYEKRGSVVVIPKEHAQQRTRIKRGLIEHTIPLQRGEMRQVILPHRTADMVQLAEDLKNDPTLAGQRGPDEMFAFYLGRGKSRAFHDEEELIEEITTKYAHLFSGKAGREAFKHLMLIRFHGAKSSLDVPDAPEDVQPWHGGLKGRKYRPRNNDNEFIARKRRERDAIRKQVAREKETDAQRKKRLEEQKERSRLVRQGEYARRINRKSGLD